MEREMERTLRLCGNEEFSAYLRSVMEERGPKLAWREPETLRNQFFDILDAAKRDFNAPEREKRRCIEALEELLLNRQMRQTMIEGEYEWIEKKRGLWGDEGRGHPSEDAFGIAFSGGGIRSATFNLGLLQSLQRYGLYRHADYLSTVSGGGYIGSSATWLKYMKPELEHPYGATRRDHGGLGGRILAWLRDHGRYLEPGKGLSTWGFVGAFLGSLLINLLILAPLFLAAVYLVYVTGDLNLLLFAGGASLLWFFLKTATYALHPVWSRRISFSRQRRERILAGKALMAGLLLLTAASVPFVYETLQKHLSEWMGSVSFSAIAAGTASFATAYAKIKQGKGDASGATTFMLSAGIVVVLYGVFLLLYHLFARSGVGSAFLPLLGLSLLFSAGIFFLPKLLGRSLPAFLSSLVLLLLSWAALLWMGLNESANGWNAAVLMLLLLPLSALFAAYTKINYVSMHRYYRNRLMEAYFPWAVIDVPEERADNFLLAEMAPQKTPYLIVNTNVNMVGSEKTKQRERGGDNFIFSPLFCGSEATGYRATTHYASGRMNLATAFAISGAAVDPNTYATRSKPVTFVMSLFNARLGYWIENPKYREGVQTLGAGYYYYIFKELFGRGLNENERYIHLADGGHFENLGLYELIRRKCRYILVSDAGRDPDFTFEDLAKIIEMARVDFGAEIEIDTAPLRPKGAEKISEAPFVHGKVTYDDGSTGKILYVKTCVVKGLGEEIYSYRRGHPDFPDQTTNDQFFDEMQFEAYRELGYQVGKRLCDGIVHTDFRDIFQEG